MQIIDSSYNFTAPITTLWDLLQDFGNIQRWWPVGSAVDIERVEIEGSGIGITRHIYNVGFASPVSERLERIDPDNYTYTLSIVGERPAGILSYEATGTLTPLEGGQVRLTYHSEFTTEPGQEAGARAFLEGAYALMYSGLEQAAARAQ